jgi:hypothetical protein
MFEEKAIALPYSVEESVLITRKNLEEGSTRELSFIKMMIASLINGKARYEAELLKALTEDLGVDEASAYKMSVYPFFQELRIAFHSLENW